MQFHALDAIGPSDNPQIRARHAKLYRNSLFSVQSTLLLLYILLLL